jgi:hypothetical protein
MPGAVPAPRPPGQGASAAPCIPRQGGPRAGFARRMAAPRASPQRPPFGNPPGARRGPLLVWAMRWGAAEGWALVRWGGGELLNGPGRCMSGLRSYPRQAGRRAAAQPPVAQRTRSGPGRGAAGPAGAGPVAERLGPRRGCGATKARRAAPGAGPPPAWGRRGAHPQPVTRLTSLPGTKTSFLMLTPSRYFCTLGWARTAARTSSLPRSRGSSTLPRSLPCT